MEKFEDLRKYTFEELKEEMAEQDLLMNTTLGLVIGGTMIDLMRLKKRIDSMYEFKLVYDTLSTAHLAIVKKEAWRKFIEWREDKTGEWREFLEWKEEKEKNGRS